MRPLMTRFVDVLMSVTELVRIDANATGMRSREGEILARAAMPMTTGRKRAAAAVLLMNALRTETVIMMTASSTS